MKKIQYLPFVAFLLLTAFVGTTTRGATTIVSDNYNITVSGTGFALDNGVNTGINPPTTRMTGTGASNLRYYQTVTTKPSSQYDISSNRLRVVKDPTTSSIGRFTLSNDGSTPFNFATLLGSTYATANTPGSYDVKVSMRNDATGIARFSFALGTAEGDATIWDFGIQLYHAASADDFYTIQKRIDTNSAGVADINTVMATTGSGTNVGTLINFLLRVTDAGAESGSAYNSRVQVSLDNGSTFIYDTKTNTSELPNGFRFDGSARYFMWDQAGNTSGNVFYDSFSVTWNSGPRTWDGGGANGNWNNATNWGGATPAAGSALIFNGTTRQTNTNDVSSLTLPWITFSNGGFSVYGNSMTISNAITNVIGDNFLSNSVSLGAATRIQSSAGNLTLGSISGTAQNLTVGGAGNSIIGGAISTTTGTLTKQDGGTLTLGGVNTYSGATTISGGTLALTGTGSIGSSTSIALATGTTLSVSGRNDGTLSLGSNQTLSGSGTVSGSISLSGTVSPGSSPGTISSGSQTWNGGGHYTFEMNQAGGMAGADPGWDLINITGGLTIAATSVNKFTVDIKSLAGSVAGDVSDFSNTTDYSWIIARTTTGVSGFDSTAFTLNTAGFSNPLGTGGFGLQVVDTNLVLRFMQLPTITTDPTSQTTAINDPVTFSVTATGNELTYQWKLNGNAISGATDSSYTNAAVHGIDAGSYTVVVSNPVGSVTSGTAILSVPPELAVQPSSHTNNAGTIATFSITATGSPILTYQWRKGGNPLSNGDNIIGANSSTLSITNVLDADEGSYSVVVSNGNGTATSSDAILTVIDPIITLQPSDLTNDAGTTATFSVAAIGTTNLTYQWKKNGVNIDSTANPSATNATLTLSGVLIADVASYNVAVTNGLGSGIESSNAVLTVNDPVISSQTPAAGSTLTKNAGESASFSVTAVGTPTLTYQWHFDSNPISGATDSNYVIGSVADENVGSYKCLVGSGSGSNVFSGFVALAVIDPPVNQNAPTNQTRNAGQIASFTATATGSAATVDWTRNGVSVGSGTVETSGSGLSGVISSTLTLNNVQDGDAGTYAAHFSNSAGTADSASATLTVIDSPVKQNGPANQTKNAGQSASFTATATGSAATVDWTRNGVSVGSGTVNSSGSGTNGITSSTLTLSNVQDGDAGTYIAHFSNSAGSDQSDSATLTIIDPPINQNAPSNQTKNAGESASFTATATGSAATVDWTRNGESVGSGTVESSGTGTNGVTSSTLTLNNVQDADAGTYVAHFSNSAGTADSSNATLTVIDPAQITGPTNLTVSAGTPAIFSVMASGGGTYSYEWTKITSISTNVLIDSSGVIAGASTESLTIVAVSDTDVATYSVIVSNSAGSATSSATLVVIDPPVKETSPVSLTRNPGETAVFTATATGSAASADWTRNGVSVGSGTVETSGNGLTGQTSTTLTLNNVQSADAGTYVAHFSNSAGTAESDPATLTISENVTISTQPQSQTANASDTVLLSVSATGTPPFSYQWKKGTNVLVDNTTNLVGQGTATLTITNSAAANNGNYSVVVSGIGSATSDAALLKIIDPAITMQPQPGTVLKGGAYVFSINAAGTGAGLNGAPTKFFKYQWYFKSTTGLTYVKQSGQTNKTLTVSSATPAKEGYYVCTVTNEYSATQYPGAQTAGVNVACSIPARLTVNVPILSVTVAPAAKTMVAGNNVTLKATPTATATQPFSYHWSFNEMPLSDSSHIVGSSSNFLSIIDVQEADEGTYRCTAVNAAGEVQSATTQGLLTVKPDEAKPVVTIFYPLNNARLTNGLTETTNMVTPFTNKAPTVTLNGKITDNGKIVGLTILQSNYSSSGQLEQIANVPVTPFYGNLPGLKYFTNDFTLGDGTNIFTAVAVDSGNNYSKALVKKYFFVRTNLLSVIEDSNGPGGYHTNGPNPKASLGFGVASNGNYLEIGRKYQIKAVPGVNTIFTNWTDELGSDLPGDPKNSTNVLLTFIMRDGLVLHAHFRTNPIVAAGVDGKYNGLAYENSGIAYKSAGLVSSLQVNTNRTFSGKLLLAGKSLPLTGSFNTSGTATTTVKRVTFGLSNLFVDMHLDWDNDTRQITGTISNMDLADPWVAKMTNDQAGYNLTLTPSRHTMLIGPGPDQSSSPGGYGGAGVTNKSDGNVIISGKAADGVSLSQTVPVSKNGYLPFFVKLYNNLGLMAGWLKLTADDISGNVTWIKQAIAIPATYPTGFTITHAEVTGTNYNPASAPLLANTNVVIEIATNNLVGTPLFWTVQVNPSSGAFKVVGAGTTSSTNKLSGTINKADGTISISYRPTGALVDSKAVGAVDQPSNSGKGAAQGTTDVSTMTLHP